MCKKDEIIKDKDERIRELELALKEAKSTIENMESAEKSIIYQLSMEDFECVVDSNYDGEEKEFLLEEADRDAIASVLRGKLDIDWMESIEAVIDARILANKESFIK